MIVVALRLPVMMIGMIEASTTRRPCMPCTRPWPSTTAMSSVPILHEQDGWKAVSACSRMNLSSCSSVCTSAPGLISRPRYGSSAGWAMISRVRRMPSRNSCQSCSVAM
ncbi:hypothetical protein D3C81_2028690 [compost metagenome]